MKKVLIYLSIFAFVAVLFAGYIFLLNAGEPAEVVAGVQKVETGDSKVDPTVLDIKSGNKRYSNDHYQFSVDYPDYLKVQESSNGERTDSVTILFTNEEKKVGFQIFIAPYLGSIVTRDRFLMDLPSGVFENPKSAVLDGVSAQTFESKSKELGETFEVWFQRGDYLYEVSTFRDQASWLSEIMQSWHFTAPVPAPTIIPSN